MTIKMHKGPVLDKDFEKYVNSNIEDAHEYLQRKQSLIENAITEHPFEFVIGAFIGGLLLGALIAKKG